MVKKIVQGIGILLVATLGIAMVVLVVGERPEDQDFSGRYAYEEVPVNLILIEGNPNVRSEPIANTDLKSDRIGTTYGGVKDSVVKIDSIMKITKAVDLNNDFVGIKTEDIFAITNWQKWFPQAIEKDPDGIVWIAKDYVEVYKKALI